MAKKFSLLFFAVLLVLGLLPVSALACESLKSGTLIKATDNAVYYYGANAKRYVFPNEKTYKTWFANFLLVIPISAELLADIPIGGNATYKPGVRLVKITTDPKVYWVDKQGTLRHIKTESIAKELWGNTWYKMIDDVQDALFVNYQIGAPIEAAVLPEIETAYSINQDKTLSDQPDPDSSEIGKIVLTGNAVNSAANLNWTTANLDAAQGFKVVVSTGLNPVYPGNDYHYLSDSVARSDSWTELSSGTYHFRVCEYLGGKCGVYSNDLVLTVGSGQSSPTNKTITLQASVSGTKVNLNWTPSFTSSLGFKIVKAEHINPIYPGDDYHYLSEPSIRSDVWESLSAGTYHFRVCEYLSGKCGVYSNDMTVTVSGSTTNTTGGTISLSGNVNSGIVYLNWVINNMTSESGFKVVKSTEPNPVYPGNDYHYLSDQNIRSDNWTNLSAGTYHFRVCEYLGGSCGVYSNDLALTIQ